MKAIWKFPIELEDEFELKMPGGAILRYVGVQGIAAWLWAEVQTDAEPTTRKFRLVGTGHEHSHTFWYEMYYIGTFQLMSFVGHLYEVTGAWEESSGQ